MPQFLRVVAKILSSWHDSFKNCQVVASSQKTQKHPPRYEEENYEIICTEFQRFSIFKTGSEIKLFSKEVGKKNLTDKTQVSSSRGDNWPWI